MKLGERNSLKPLLLRIKENITKAGELDLPVISDDIPKNKESYRKALESCQDFLWFEDRFLNTESLVLFEELIKNPKIKSIRILTSLVRNKGINDEFLNKIREFETILAGNSMILEVKVASTKSLHSKIHDRYVLGSNILWDLPPASSVLDGQSSMFKVFQADTKNYNIISRDYEDWWNDPGALEIKSKWNEIKKLAMYFSARTYDKGETYSLNCCICGKPVKLRFVPEFPYCHEHLRILRKGK